jgi:hypothetical protein
MVQAINDVRPAGVLVTVEGAVPPQKVNLELRLETLDTLLEQDLRGAHDAVRNRIADYFAKLPTGEAGSVNKLVGLALSVPGVEDLRIVSATVNGGTNVLNREAGILEISGFPTVLGALHIGDRNLATSLLAAVTFPEGEDPPDAGAINASLQELIAYVNELNASDPPTGDTPADDAERARRVLNYGKLLLMTPLPDHPAGDIAAFDTALAEGGSPTLPAPSAVLPYRVSFVFTQATGLATRLTQGSQSYSLTPFERLTLASVEVAAEA